MHMIESKPVADQNAELDALLADLELVGNESDEIIEAADDALLGEVELEAAVERAEAQEDIAKHYDAADDVAKEAIDIVVQAELEVIDPLALLTTEPEKSSDDAPEVTGDAGTTEPTTPPPSAADAGATTEKPAPKKRVCYSSKTERLQDKFKDKLDEYMVLELDDAALEGDALAAKVAETKQTIKDSGVKVQSRITFILEFIGGKSASLNGVIKTAFTLLAKDGKLTTGDEGNLHKALLAHPYNEKSARAMGGNSLLAMRQLKVVVAGAKGEWVPNPQSLVLMKMNSMLGL